MLKKETKDISALWYPASGLAPVSLVLSSMKKSSDLENNPGAHSSSEPNGYTGMPTLETQIDEFPHLWVPLA